MSLALSDLRAAEAEASKRAASNDYLAIWLRSSGQIIGDIFAIAEPSDHIDQSDTFSVGWNINPKFGKTGYAWEAAKALFANLFSERHARRLYAYVDEGNLASETLCRRLGMRQEGLFREFVSFVKDDRGAPIFENTKQYALLASEWPTIGDPNPKMGGRR